MAFCKLFLIYRQTLYYYLLVTFIFSHLLPLFNSHNQELCPHLFVWSYQLSHNNLRTVIHIWLEVACYEMLHNASDPGNSLVCPCDLTEHRAMKAYWGSGNITPRILELDTRWRWVVSFTPRSLYPQGKSPWATIIMVIKLLG